MAIQAGAKAPDFKFLSDKGENITLSNFLGKWIVLYFYPKDNTPGCTMEACSFRDNMEAITEMDAVVIGVSPDNEKSHNKFRDKFNLNFHLISDIDKTICNKYGVIGEKTMFGKKVHGVIRSTFIINPESIIRHVFSKVKVEGHVEVVIKKISELSVL